MALSRRTSAKTIRHESVRGRDRGLVGLLQALADQAAPTRRWAARDLAAHPGSAPDLLARLRVEQDASVRQTLLTSLAQIRTAQAAEGLIPLLGSEDAALRNEVVEALKAMPEAIAGFMPSLLANADPDVRILAVNVLESLRHPQVESWLINVICADPNVNVCATALDLLSEVGTSAAESALLAVERRFPDEPYVTFAAQLALKRLREG
jgi:HEAT repeat protein